MTMPSIKKHRGVEIPPGRQVAGNKLAPLAEKNNQDEAGRHKLRSASFSRLLLTVMRGGVQSKVPSLT